MTPAHPLILPLQVCTPSSLMVTEAVLERPLLTVAEILMQAREPVAKRVIVVARSVENCILFFRECLTAVAIEKGVGTHNCEYLAEGRVG